MCINLLVGVQGSWPLPRLQNCIPLGCLGHVFPKVPWTFPQYCKGLGEKLSKHRVSWMSVILLCALWPKVHAVYFTGWINTYGKAKTCVSPPFLWATYSHTSTLLFTLSGNLNSILCPIFSCTLSLNTRCTVLEAGIFFQSSGQQIESANEAPVSSSKTQSAFFPSRNRAWKTCG